MTDLKLKTERNHTITCEQFDRKGDMYIDIENNDEFSSIQTWLTVSEAQLLARHIVEALAKIGETI